MIKNATYIRDNILIADEVNTTLKYCKKTTGVDLSVKNLYKITTPGLILQSNTIIGEYEKLPKCHFSFPGTNQVITGWFLPRGDYICELNEGCKLGPRDIGYIILRSSLNRNGVSLTSAIWDPGFTTQHENVVESMSVRVTVNTDLGVYIEENARVGQLMVFEADEMIQYGGMGHQFQGKGLK